MNVHRGADRADAVDRTLSAERLGDVVVAVEAGDVGIRREDEWPEVAARGVCVSEERDLGRGGGRLQAPLLLGDRFPRGRAMPLQTEFLSVGRAEARRSYL